MAGPSSSPSLLAVVPVAVAFCSLYAGLFDALLLTLFTAARHDHDFARYLWPALFHGVAAKIAISAAFTLFLLFLILRLTTRPPRGDTKQQWIGPGKVLLFPCKTTHSRMFPRKHSFSYSYIVVGVPVGWEGNAGGLVSVGKGNRTSGLLSWFSLGSQAQKGWYDIDAGDYLERGNAELGLRGKLDSYLRTQGADPATYPHAYLVTAARFLGYHFNPVSFWYLYDAEKSLAAMVLEVNNTFGERRAYFLTPGDVLPNQLGYDPNSPTLGNDQVTSAQPSAPPRTVLKQSWPKDFHVSPFNSRKGSYSLAASDPLSPFMQGTGPINNSINLVSSKGHGKLVARLIPDGAALDPLSMTLFEKLKFLTVWWWVGFLTFPRIVKEAGVLFFRRKLHVWFRPEPLKESLGRMADSTESQLEPIFKRYLRHLIEQSTVPLAVKYTPCGLPQNTVELMLSPAARDGADTVEELEFKVLTPVFYARFVYYAHDLEAFFCELNESCTIWLSRPDLLPKFALKKPSPTLSSSSFTDYPIFKLIQTLRVRPERIVRPLTSSATPTEAPRPADIRGFRISSMDGYALAHETTLAKEAYRRCVMKLFVADRIAFGLVPLLEVQRFVVQAWLAWRISASEYAALSVLFLYAMDLILPQPLAK
ncbi:hypothetical protein B0H63DRAFT_528009 [Podospora didyma]|uniref:Cyclopropane-fatty-acyl-phospholipid synthase n=1 Tax=Podospora didyma TaxID=330526 RepID=A0AAE0K5Z7_9PEZI|nr:hypothetical protein B0H63DRAFT_528009 [Podospora didyma]